MKLLTMMTMVVVFVFSTVVHAEQSTPPQGPGAEPSTILPIMVECGTPEVVGQMLVRYQEVPTAEGTATWRIPTGQLLTGPMVIWINPETKTYSITIQPSDDMVCVVLPGNGFGAWTSTPGTPL
jgi:hypothetical protein